VIIRLESTQLACKNQATVATVLHIPFQMCQELPKFETFSPYIHPEAIDPTKPSPGACSELPNEPSCKNKFTQVAIFVFLAQSVIGR